jgi:hypothetical protein
MSRSLPPAIILVFAIAAVFHAKARSSPPPAKPSSPPAQRAEDIVAADELLAKHLPQLYGTSAKRAAELRAKRERIAKSTGQPAEQEVAVAARQLLAGIDGLDDFLAERPHLDLLADWTDEARHWKAAFRGGEPRQFKDEAGRIKAPLARSAGGWGQIGPKWTSTRDAGYRRMLELVQAAAELSNGGD